MCASYESQCEEFIELSIARTPGVSLCTFDPYRNLCRLQKNSANDISQERDSSSVLSFFFFSLLFPSRCTSIFAKLKGKLKVKLAE